MVAYWFKHDLSRIMRRLTEKKIPFEKLDALLKDLNTMYTRARQAAITQEITEVCGGAAAQRREREEEMRV